MTGSEVTMYQYLFLALSLSFLLNVKSVVFNHKSWRVYYQRQAVEQRNIAYNSISLSLCQGVSDRPGEQPVGGGSGCYSGNSSLTFNLHIGPSQPSHLQRAKKDFPITPP